MNKIAELISKPEYDFLDTNQYLGDNIILIGISGSRAYGTNIDTPEHVSDYDIRGVALSPKRDILLGKDFEQVIDTNTDTCIYSFNKFVNLVSSCNPNTIEILGLRPEDYGYISAIGRELINNSDMFLSKLAINKFGGYANEQLRRIENFLSSERYEQYKKEEHIFNSIKNSLASTIANYAPFRCENGEVIINNMMSTKNIQNTVALVNSSFSKMFREIDSENGFKLYIDKSDREDMDVEIFADIDFHHYPIRDFSKINKDMSTIITQFDKLGKRNIKKDDMHLNKHAMHLVRLYYSALDILERKQIITYREKEHDLLMSIRNGEFMNKDGLFIPEFFELVNDLEIQFQYAAENTDLPDLPDMEKIEDFKANINEKIVKGEFNKEVFKFAALR